MIEIKYATQEDISEIKQSLTSNQDGVEYLGYMGFEKFGYEQGYRTPIIVAKEIDIDMVLGDKLVGFMVLDYDSVKTECVIHSLYVYNEYRKQGIAKQLYEFCLNEVKEKSFNFIRANVYDRNVPMRNFITKLGFEQIGYRDYAHKRYGERWRLNFYGKFLDD